MEKFAHSSDSSREHTGKVVNSLLVADFMTALQRLFRIGVYYPSGHVVLDQATDRFLSLLDDVGLKRHSVRVEDDGGDLLVEKIRLDSSQPFVSEFRQLMASLNVLSIEINRGVSRDDLLFFIRKMISARSARANSKQFAVIEISDLPSSIRVSHKRFVASGNRGDGGSLDSAAQNLNAFLEALAGHGLTEAQIEACTKLLASLPKKIGELSVRSSDLPVASWDDVAFLLAQAVQGKPLSTRSGSHGNLDMLASILGNLEKDAQDSKTREAINLLVSIIKKPSFTVQAKKDLPLTQLPDGRSEIVVLQDFTDKNMLSAAILLKIQDISLEYETLSVLMQLAQGLQPQENQERMLRFMSDILVTSPNEKVWEIITCGLYDILKIGDRNILAAAIRMVVDPLRRAAPGDSMTFFLKIIESCKEAEADLLWPFVLNEQLMCGSSGNIDVYRRIYVYLTVLPWQKMVQSLPVLQGLDAFTRGPVSSDIFAEIAPSCYPLCAFLLRTALGPQIREQLIAGLKNSSSDALIRSLAPLLDPALAEHKTFLDSYLRRPPLSELSEGMKAMAGNLIVEKLTLLPQEQRDQSWVPEAINTLGGLPSGKVLDLLNQIINNKRLLVIPEWPLACRKSAEEAKKMVRRSKAVRGARS
jgi:hypothetical protein